MGTELTLALHGGIASVYEAVPEPGMVPAVIVLHGRWGLESHIRKACDRLAAEGFVALAPDLYYGKIARSPKEAEDLMSGLDLVKVDQEIYACVTYLMSHAKTSRKKVGVLGFCMGGQLALYAASKFPQVGACVDFYGLHPRVNPDFGAIKCPVLGFFGEKDQVVPQEHARLLEKVLKARGIQTDFTIFPGVDHGFFNDSRTGTYHAGVALKAWPQMLAFFREKLAGIPVK